MSPEEMVGKFVVGIFEDREQTDYGTNYEEIVARAKAVKESAQ